MTDRAFPSWFRLTLHGGIFGAVVGVYADSLRDDFWLLIRAIGVGLGAGALAAACSLALLRTSVPWWKFWLAYVIGALSGGLVFLGWKWLESTKWWKTWLAYVSGALAGGLVFFSWEWLESKTWFGSLFVASLWTLGWLIFPTVLQFRKGRK